MLLPHMVCNALVAGGRLLGAEQQAFACLLTADNQQPRHYTQYAATAQLQTRAPDDGHKCPKHVERIISAIKNSVASSWFSSLRSFEGIS